MNTPGNGDFPLEEHVLDNGLRVILHPDDRLPLVCVNLWYHVGSKNERPGRTGFAHLFEHMLFQGSQNIPVNDHFRLVQQVGGVANGSTWYDRTNYYETLPSSHLELGLWLESDRMGFLLPAMTQDKLENQRSVVMNERRERVDNQPYGTAMERLCELVFPEGHPYRWPVLGYMEDIEAATLEDVSTFFRTWYGPDNAVLTLAGDVQPQEAFRLANRWFGDLAPTGKGEAPIGGGVPEAADSLRRQIVEDDVRLTRFYLACAVPPVGTPEWYAAVLLSEVLTGGRSSTLTDDLVYRRQLAQSIGSWVMPTEECAMFAVIATARHDAEPKDLEDALFERLDETLAAAPDEEALEHARSRLLAGHYDRLQTLDQRADMISQAATYHGDPAMAFAAVDRIAAVTREDILELSRSWADFRRGALVVVTPREADVS